MDIEEYMNSRRRSKDVRDDPGTHDIDPTLAAFIVCGPLQFLVSHTRHSTLSSTRKLEFARVRVCASKSTRE